MAGRFSIAQALQQLEALSPEEKAILDAKVNSRTITPGKVFYYNRGISDRYNRGQPDPKLSDVTVPNDVPVSQSQKVADSEPFSGRSNPALTARVAAGGDDTPSVGSVFGSGGAYVPPSMPQFDSAAGGYFQGLMNTQPDTKNDWSPETAALLNRISAYEPEEKGAYAEQAYNKIVKNIIGTSWLPRANEINRGIALQEYKNDVASHNESVDNQNALTQRGLINEAMQHMQNVKNPTEASSIATALQNIGAKGFSAGMFDNKYLSPSSAMSAANTGANGLLGYDKLMYGNDMRNYAHANDSSLDGNFSGLARSGTDFGENGCGTVAGLLLNGNAYSSLISPDCEVTMDNAIAKRAWIPSSSGYQPQYGDAVILKNPKDGHRASHIVISTGGNGYVGNKSSLAGSGSGTVGRGAMSDFNGYQVLGFIPSSRGFASARMNNQGGRASNSQKPTADDKTAGIIQGAMYAKNPIDEFRKAAMANPNSPAVAQAALKYIESHKELVGSNEHKMFEAMYRRTNPQLAQPR